MSESRNNSESRGYGYVSVSSESRNTGESKREVIKIRYNNLDDIDSIIEKLEREMPTSTSNNPRINEALEKRRQKIEELKKLAEEAKVKLEEEKQLKMLEQSNDELDCIIYNMKQMVKKLIKPNSSYSSYNFSSESHGSGESRW